MENENASKDAVNEFEEYSKEVGGDNSDEIEYFDGDKKVSAPKKTEDVVYGELSDKEVLDVVLKEEDDNKCFKIKDVRKLKPLLEDETGKKIPPIKSDKSDVSYYKTKVEVTFYDSKYKILVPSIFWFVKYRSGSMFLKPSFRIINNEKLLESKFVPNISKLHYNFCKVFNKEPKKLSQKAFLEMMKDKWVKLYNDKYESQINAGDFEKIGRIKEFVTEEEAKKE